MQSCPRRRLEQYQTTRTHRLKKKHKKKLKASVLFPTPLPRSQHFPPPLSRNCEPIRKIQQQVGEEFIPMQPQYFPLL